MRCNGRYLRVLLHVGLTGMILVGSRAADAGGDDSSAAWRDAVLNRREGSAARLSPPLLTLLQQDFERLEYGRSVIKTPLRLGSQHFSHGLGTHSVSHLRITSADPIMRFSAIVGVDRNDNNAGERGSVEFVIDAGGREIQRSGVLRCTDGAKPLDITLDAVEELNLRVTDGGDGSAYDHADWAEAKVTTRSGRSYWLDELPLAGPGGAAPPYPFSFLYDGKPVHELLATWPQETRQDASDQDRDRVKTVWTDPQTGLQITFVMTRFRKFPAAEWMLWFENVGQSDTKILADVNAADVALLSPRTAGEPYRLYRTHGGTPDPQQLAASTESVDREHPRRLTAGGGRSSQIDLPFFKIEAGRGSLIMAVGWSGCWKADVTTQDDRLLRLTAGLDRTHFVLHPGERVRSPRMLVLFQEGDTWDANARFRELIYQHYAARRSDQRMLPLLFCNTCFTRGGGWLNECTAENQISLIDSYAPLGLEALLTDAGWFKGGWPSGAGNWTPREDAYPQGMGPVAAAAQEKGLVYGLWFEPERVVANTDLHRNHPDWLLRRQEGADDTYLLNFGLPAVQEHFFEIVRGFMDLPGFRFYRQDFNMDPLPYWRFSDAPDRQGLSEMKYIEGLYAYWDRLATAWPDSIREECASGGHRMDLETVMRMHLHQKTDYWFDNDVDQAALWGASQYLPNNTFVGQLIRLDDYSFHSTLASSLCLGWIADAPDFDAARAKVLTDRYLAIRHLLTGAWYPLLPYSRDQVDWAGMQFHRADLEEGLLLVFRRGESPYGSADLVVRGLTTDATYEVLSDTLGALGTFSGTQLSQGLTLTLPEKQKSDLLVYRRK
ncbi:MAG: alpha-galactosidase [Pirellulaceae bacterium]